MVHAPIRVMLKAGKIKFNIKFPFCTFDRNNYSKPPKLKLIYFVLGVVLLRHVEN